MTVSGTASMSAVSVELAHFDIIGRDPEMLRREALGRSRILGPCEDPDTGLVVGLFTDPEDQVVGLANAT